MGGAALDAIGAAVFFAPAGADAWRGVGVGADTAFAAADWVEGRTGFGVLASAFAGAAFFAACFETGRVAACFGCEALPAAAFFAGAFFADVFAGCGETAAFLAGFTAAASFFAAVLPTGFAAFFAAAFFATAFFATAFFAMAFFAAAFLAGATFLAAFAAFFAGFFAATGGVSFYSLVTGKRAVIPCRATCSNRAARGFSGRRGRQKRRQTQHVANPSRRLERPRLHGACPALRRGAKPPPAIGDIAR